VTSRWCFAEDTLLSRPDRRRGRLNPKAKLWPGQLGFYPALLPQRWYQLHTASRPNPVDVWVETAHGMIRVQRVDAEIRGEPA
jgi:hypothetical protein